MNFSSLEVTDFRDKNLGVLEGTGSVVLDRKENIAYACLSKRCEEAAFLAFCDTYGFAPVPFKARQHDADVYHTNVILSVAEDFAVVASELVTENKEALMDHLHATKKTVIEVTGEQIDHFCGNCLELMGEEKLYLMSEEAYKHFTKEQIAKIEATHKIVHVPMDVISTYGGGSMRCILAENYC